MKTFAEKIKNARAQSSLTQLQLGDLCDVSARAIQLYEAGDKMPRQSTLLKLARALKVSVRYLSDDDCDDPLADIDKDGYIEEAHKYYRTVGAKDIDELLNVNRALFAGGELSEEQKDEYFQAIMAAYLTCKEEAKKKFGKKDQ